MEDDMNWFQVNKTGDPLVDEQLACYQDRVNEELRSYSSPAQWRDLVVMLERLRLMHTAVNEITLITDVPPGREIFRDIELALLAEVEDRQGVSAAHRILLAWRWFTDTSGATIGVVAARTGTHDPERGEWMAYLGCAPGLDSDADRHFVVDFGVKLSAEQAHGFFPQLDASKYKGERQ